MTLSAIKLYRSKTLSAAQEVSAGETVVVNSKVTLDTGIAYRQILYLAVPRHPQANGIVLHEPKFSAQFSSNRINTGFSSSYLQAPWTYQDNKVIVQFNRPWHIREVTTSQSAIVGFYRIDGEAIAEEATVSGFAGDPIGPEFQSHHFAMSFSPASKAAIPKKAKGRAHAKTESGRKAAAHRGANAPTTIHLENGDVLEITVDEHGHEAISIQEATAAQMSFHGFETVTINSYPTTPRVLVPASLLADLSPPEDEPPPVFDTVWQQAGELRGNTDCGLGKILSQQVVPKISQAFSELSVDEEILWVPIILESDSPCIWRLTNLALPFHYVVDRFEQDTDKVVLDFVSGTAAPQRLPIRLPEGDITHASFRIDVSNQGNLNDPQSLDQQSNNTGLILNQNNWFAAKLIPGEAGFFGAIAILVSLHTSEIELVASLVDGNNTPTGKPLIDTKASVTKNGRQQWVTLKFESKRLDSIPYWLKLSAPKGEGVWLCQPGNATEIRKGSLLSPAKAIITMPSLFPITQWLTSNFHPEPNTPLFVMLANNTPLTLQPDEQQSFQVETPNLVTGAESLQIRQLARGKLTFSLPRIEFTP
ncbi:hypothetical protein [Hahella ganghwensis]|uniref:hypothetical protein n=1 Tax=Hahella ganghwensis TaxID=286420 RepID=UPI00037727C4|nr:hypothetical protein [Hahella ganghwensis]